MEEGGLTLTLEEFIQAADKLYSVISITDRAILINDKVRNMRRCKTSIDQFSFKVCCSIIVIARDE